MSPRRGNASQPLLGQLSADSLAEKCASSTDDRLFIGPFPTCSTCLVGQVCMDGPMEPTPSAQAAVFPTRGEFSSRQEIFLRESGACYQPLGPSFSVSW